MSGIEIVPLSSIRLREGFNARGAYRGIDELAASIQAIGLEQPLVVYHLPDDRTFYLQSGFRRRLALLQLERKMGKALRVPCRVKEHPSHRHAQLAALAVDEMADPLRRYDVAARIVMLRETFTQAEVAEVVGLSQASITKYERLFRDLDPELLAYWSKSPSPEQEIKTATLEKWATLPRSLQRRALKAWTAGEESKLPKKRDGVGTRPTMARLRATVKEFRTEMKKLDGPELARYKTAEHVLRYVLGEVKTPL